MENVRISWKHDEYTPESQVGVKVVNNKLSKSVSTVLRNRTTCFIKNSDGDVLYTGVVKQYFKDKPNRKTALKESFKKAVSQIPTKAHRAALWEQFKNNSPKCVNC